MPGKRDAGVQLGIVVAVGLGVALAAACGGAPTPPPLMPDGPDMDPDAAVYQEDATTAPAIP